MWDGDSDIIYNVASNLLDPARSDYSLLAMASLERAKTVSSVSNTGLTGTFLCRGLLKELVLVKEVF